MSWKQHSSRQSEVSYSWEIQVSTSLSLSQSHPSTLTLSTAAQQQPSTDGTWAPALLPASGAQAWERGFLKTHLKALVLQMTTLGRYIFPVTLELPISSKAVDCLTTGACLCCWLSPTGQNNTAYRNQQKQSNHRNKHTKKNPPQNQNEGKKNIRFQLGLHLCGSKGVTLMNSVGTRMQTQASLPSLGGSQLQSFIITKGRVLLQLAGIPLLCKTKEKQTRSKEVISAAQGNHSKD